MRRRVGIVAACSVLAVAGAVPATAMDLSSSDVAQAYSLMMTKAEAKSVGVSGKQLDTFAVSHSDKGTPDAPWLCDLSGSAEVEGKGAKALVSMEFLSLQGEGVTDTSQEIHVYGSAAKAKAAYDALVSKVKQCEGQQQTDSTPDDPAPLMSVLTNGTKKAADGDPYLWVRSTTSMPGVDDFASHEYLTVRHFGRYLQIIQLENEGQNAADLTAKQVRALDKLTDSLGDRWRATFG